MDWSPELWIACHDDDEQNARLARHAWEDNGLDVPENFLDSLLDFLGGFVFRRIWVYSNGKTGHDNAYVRTSTAAAIAEAVELWPQTIQTTLTTLEDYYREKVWVYLLRYLHCCLNSFFFFCSQAKVLAPEFDEYVS